MKVLLVAFQTPHADSFCQSWAMTSRRASERLSSSFLTAEGGGRVGVEDGERLCTFFLRLCGECEVEDGAGE